MTMLDQLGENGVKDADDAIRELVERRFQIEEMQKSEGWALWADFLAALSSGYQSRLLKGRHKDLLDYRYDAGVLEGIRLALTAAENLDGRIAAARRIVAETRFADNMEEDEHEHS